MAIIKVIIIGAVAAGMSAATKLRRLDQEADIVVYEKGQDISYGACGMPYLLSGVIPQEEDLIARTKSDFERQRITILLQHEVVTVIPETKTISVFNHTSNDMVTDTYDKLIIASGANAARTYVSGSNAKGIHVLKHLDDARKLKESLTDANSVAIIGGGYIGCEVAENIALRGKQVVLIENDDQILRYLDYDIARQAELELESIGVSVKVRERLESYQQEENHIIVNTNMNSYQVDVVVEAIGIRPNTAFLKDTGIEMLGNGALKVNDFLETSIKDIYAAGDCAAYQHEFYVPLATHAVKAGKLIAENIVGKNKVYPPIKGASIIKIGTLSIAKTGVGYDEATRQKLDYGYVDVQTKTKPSYYPGGKDYFVRIVYENETGLLKGAQIYSEKDTNSDINIMTLAISKQITAQEFSTFDFAYSPPFSSVNNPLQIATKKIKV